MFEEHSSELVVHAPPLSGGASTEGGVHVPVVASHERQGISEKSDPHIVSEAPVEHVLVESSLVQVSKAPLDDFVVKRSI